MSGVRRTGAAVGGVDVAALGGRIREGAAGTARSVGALRIPELVLFFLLIAIGGLPIQSIGPVPVSQLVVAAICAVALLRRPQQDIGRYAVLVPVLIVALFYVGVVSVFADPTEGAGSWESRLLRMSAATVMLFVLASGRIDARSAVVGMFSALAVNVPLFYAGLVSDAYGGYLTGLIGDKNQSGLAYCLVGLLMLWAVRSTTARALVIAFSASALWLTGSRTSIAAFGVGLAWIYLGPRLPLLGRWALAAVSAGVVSLLAEDYSQIGTFSDREGSDALRARIDAASEVKVGQSGFFGQGLGEAYVSLADGDWFFHNSYWSALVEGGWPWTVAVVGVTVVVTLQPFRHRVPPELGVVLGIGAAILVCATRLGEVFYTSIWAVALGIAIRLLSGADGDAMTDVRHPPGRRRAR